MLNYLCVMQVEIHSSFLHSLRTSLRIFKTLFRTSRIEHLEQGFAIVPWQCYEDEDKEKEFDSSVIRKAKLPV